MVVVSRAEQLGGQSCCCCFEGDPELIGWEESPVLFEDSEIGKHKGISIEARFWIAASCFEGKRPREKWENSRRFVCFRGSRYNN